MLLGSITRVNNRFPTLLGTMTANVAETQNPQPVTSEPPPYSLLSSSNAHLVAGTYSRIQSWIATCGKTGTVYFHPGTGSKPRYSSQPRRLLKALRSFCVAVLCPHAPSNDYLLVILLVMQLILLQQLAIPLLKLRLLLCIRVSLALY